MTERENELKAALAENGTFDSEKAGRFAADGVLQLHRQLKKNDRFLAITTLMCVALLAFCIEKLIFASSTKAIVGFGVTLLYVLVFTVLIKLWYWIVNTRITLQKDLEAVAVADCDRSAGARGAAGAAIRGRPGLGRAVSPGASGLGGCRRDRGTGCRPLRGVLYRFDAVCQRVR